MTREDLLRELRSLAPADLAPILRDLLEQEATEPMPHDQWLQSLDRLIAEHRPAWERLARR